MNALDDYESRFIKSNNLKADDLASMLDIITEICEISENGYVHFINDSEKILSDKERIYTVLSARYLAHNLQVSLNRDVPISASVEAQELAEMLMMEKNTVQARVSEYRKKNKVSDVSKGVYVATAQGVKDFLSELSKEKKRR